jgi:hypothetical protein
LQANGVDSRNAVDLSNQATRRGREGKPLELLSRHCEQRYRLRRGVLAKGSRLERSRGAFFGARPRCQKRRPGQGARSCSPRRACFGVPELRLSLFRKLRGVERRTRGGSLAHVAGNATIASQAGLVTAAELVSSIMHGSASRGIVDGTSRAVHQAGYERGVTQSPLTQPLFILAERWHLLFRGPARRAMFATLSLAVLFSALGARFDLARSRLLGLGLAGVLLLVAGVVSTASRRRLRDPERILLGPVGRVDRLRAGRALRALSLVGPDGDVRVEGTSPDLARLHVARVMADLPSEAALSLGSRRANRVRVVGWALGALALAITMGNLWSVLEGADLLLARGGEAPVSMQWLEDVEVTVRPPDYLHAKTMSSEPTGSLVIPYGSLVTFRGVPARAGRQLALSDGVNEVAFADDGTATLVARWSVTQSRTLRVVARFGQVVIPQRLGLKVTSVADTAPNVTLEGAPRQVLLVDEVRALPIRYEANDDHGLREVHLVLRSAAREERRVLSRFDGETRSDKGGYLLNLRDPFLARSHAPIEITVEAEDNDPLTGPKWGASPAITVVPPIVGQPEALCLDALTGLRSALVDTLDWRLGREMPEGQERRGAFAKEDSARMRSDERRLVEALATAHGGVRIPTPLQAIVFAAQEAVGKATAAETAAPSRESRAKVVAATERLVLVTDAVVRGLALRDARGSASQLSDVADDLARGLGQEQSEAPDNRSRGSSRAAASTRVLSDGSDVLGRLGVLGHDIGEIVEADLSRVKRAVGDGNLPHAELAARDLAARLREPDPSFGSQGSGPPTGGEAGGAGGAPDGEAQSPDDVERAYAEAQDLERLVQEHAGQLGKTEEALSAASTAEEQRDAPREAQQHAKAIREAVAKLPRVSNGSQSWTSKGSAARDLAEQMARALEEGRSEDALQSGRSSMGSLDEARRMLEKGAWLADPTGEQIGVVGDARRKIESEASWAEDQAREAHRRAGERARSELQQGGAEEEKLADRVRDLAQRGREGASLPQQAIEAIGAAERASRDAAEALKRGDGDRGIERQRQAQRALEQAQSALQGGEESGGETDEGTPHGRVPVGGAVAIPQTHKGPDDFRRRVMRGLAEPAGGSIKEAWRRYAEGLLR